MGCRKQDSLVCWGQSMPGDVLRDQGRVHVLGMGYGVGSRSPWCAGGSALAGEGLSFKVGFRTLE